MPQSPKQTGKKLQKKNAPTANRKAAPKGDALNRLLSSDRSGYNEVLPTAENSDIAGIPGILPSREPDLPEALFPDSPARENAATATVGHFGGALRLQRKEEPAYAEFKGPSVNKTGRVSSPTKQYLHARFIGVKVRAKPHGGLDAIDHVKYNTEVQVQAMDNTRQFYFIIADTGVTGWINKQFVALDPPEPRAQLHHITEANLTTILKEFYIDTGKWTLSTGNDYTTLAAAVITANGGRKGVYVDWKLAKKYKKNHKLKSFFDPWMIDNFAIYHGSKILMGHNIWLPSAAYVRNLQKSGIIGSRPGWINFAVDLGKGIAGFYSGVKAGLYGAIWDTLVGLWELGKSIVGMVKGIFDGSLFQNLSDLYDVITNMTWDKFMKMVEDIVTMGKEAFGNFVEQWTHPNTWKKWFFRGKVIGAIALEVLLAIFSGGASLGVKVLAKIGKYMPKLASLLRRVLRVADDLDFRKKKNKKGGDTDNEKDRDKDRDDDKDMRNDDRAWEQARVLAAMITEQHDLKDTSVGALITTLNTTVGAKFKQVRGYRAIPKVTPGHFEIIQTARKKYVKKDYTPKLKAPKNLFFRHLVGKSLEQLKQRARQLRWKFNDKLRTGKGWVFTDENGLERIRYRIKKDGQWHHEQTGYIRWADESGNLLDVNGKVIMAGDSPIHLSDSMAQIRAKCGGDGALFENVMKQSHISIQQL